jgi:hypothetical protein
VTKKSWEHICWVPPTVFKISSLKYRRQFYIRNPILFLNYPNNFYICFLSYTFASGTISYSLFFLTSFHLRLDDGYVLGRHADISERSVDFPKRRRIGSCWRAISFNLTKKIKIRSCFWKPLEMLLQTYHTECLILI